MSNAIKRAKITIAGKEVYPVPSSFSFNMEKEDSYNKEIILTLPPYIMNQMKDEKFTSLKLTTENGWEFSIRKI